ncbi:MAG: hypothetical protein ACKVS9_11035, partial [Phycisphaerae bacterium]
GQAPPFKFKMQSAKFKVQIRGCATRASALLVSDAARVDSRGERSGEVLSWEWVGGKWRAGRVQEVNGGGRI